MLYPSLDDRQEAELSDKPKNSKVVSELEGSVLNVHQQLDLMEKYIARRFDEISMEINATSQQVDMAEEGLGKKFGDILEIMAAISYQGDGLTQVNSGVELKAVIEDTEQAANKILDAADRISENISNNANWNSEEERPVLLKRIEEDVQNIIMACTFQDLTGQRIRKTLENMQIIEDRLNGTLERLGIEIDMPEKADAVKSVGGAKAQGQEAIDAILSSERSS